MWRDSRRDKVAEYFGPAEIAPPTDAEGYVAQKRRYFEVHYNECYIGSVQSTPQVW